MNGLPRKRALLAFHRWLGLGAAFFLILLAVTGLMLNHVERLGLNRVTVRADFILKRYGMLASGEMVSYTLESGATVSHVADRLYFDQHLLAEGGRPLALLEHSGLVAVVMEDAVLLATAAGELVERMALPDDLAGAVSAGGYGSDGVPVVVTPTGLWTAGSDWLEWTAYRGAVEPAVLRPAELDARTQAAILEAYQGAGIPLDRVLLDLHSGRLLGVGGRTVMDLSALAVILLVVSGLTAWLRRSRRKPATSKTN